METALFSVVSNALRYSDPATYGGSGKAVLDVDDEDGGVRIAVSNDGLEFTRERWREVAEGGSPHPLLGWQGAALALAQQIIEMHGGRVELADVGELQTTVAIWLPLGS